MTQKLYGLLLLLLVMSRFYANGQQVLGERSQQTLHRIEEIDNRLSAAQELGGLFAAYGLIVQPPGGTEGEDIIDAVHTVNDVAGTDADSYTTIADYVNSLDAIKRERIEIEILDLISADESSGDHLLSDDERRFWNDFVNDATNPSYGQGQSTGEPHLKTFDGYSYDLQAAGEFILCKSSNQFGIQVRQKPLNQSVSVNSAVAMNVHGQKICFYADDFPDIEKNTPLRINGKPRTFNSRFIVLKNGGAIEKISEGEYLVLWETGEKALVKMYSNNGVMMDVTVTVPRNSKTNMQGLLGNNNGSSGDELKNSNGTLLPSKSWKNEIQQYISFNNINNQFGEAEKEFNKELVKKFADTWRVTDENSLFSYQIGKTTKSFSDKKFPFAYHSIADLSSEQVQKARETCKAAGVSDENMHNCIYDVAFTGNNFFAQANAYLSKSNDLLTRTGIKTRLSKLPPVKSQVKAKLNGKAKKLLGL